MGLRGSRQGGGRDGWGEEVEGLRGNWGFDAPSIERCHLPPHPGPRDPRTPVSTRQSHLHGT